MKKLFAALALAVGLCASALAQIPFYLPTGILACSPPNTPTDTQACGNQWLIPFSYFDSTGTPVYSPLFNATVGYTTTNGPGTYKFVLAGQHTAAYRTIRNVQFSATPTASYAVPVFIPLVIYTDLAGNNWDCTNSPQPCGPDYNTGIPIGQDSNYEIWSSVTNTSYPRCFYSKGRCTIAPLYGSNTPTTITDPNGNLVTNFVFYNTRSYIPQSDGSMLSVFSDWETAFLNNNNGQYATDKMAVGAPAVDATGVPITFRCTRATGYAGGTYPVCSWSGPLNGGDHLLFQVPGSESQGSLTVEAALPFTPPPPPPPTCGTPTTPPCDE